MDVKRTEAQRVDVPAAPAPVAAERRRIVQGAQCSLVLCTAIVAAMLAVPLPWPRLVLAWLLFAVVWRDATALLRIVADELNASRSPTPRSPRR